ncbi:MAG TPA: hypothetical protein VF721_13710 [Pyrinomonadaceae bacterium]|jgi:hypothetical protein
MDITKGLVGVCFLGLVTNGVAQYVFDKNFLGKSAFLILAFGMVEFVAYKLKDFRSWDVAEQIMSVAVLVITPLLCLFIIIFGESDTTTVQISSANQRKNYDAETRRAEATIRNFHKAINDGKCGEAFALLTKRYKEANPSRGTLDKFQSFCKNTTEIEVNRLNHSEIDKDNSRQFDAQVSWKQGKNKQEKQESVMFGLVREGSDWLIDLKLYPASD